MEILPVVVKEFFLTKAISHYASVKVYKCKMIGDFETWKGIPEHFWCVLREQEGKDQTVQMLSRFVLFFHSWLSSLFSPFM
jgi:hypothetical protein